MNDQPEQAAVKPQASKAHAPQQAEAVKARTRWAITDIALTIGVLICVASLFAFGWAALQLIWSERADDEALKLLLSGSVGFVAGLMLILVVKMAR